MNLHKRRRTLEEIAKEINPVIRGIINYYHHFWEDNMQMVWNLLNERLLKWVKWEKGLNKLASARYQNTKYHLIYSHIGYWYINEQANVQYDLLT